jgi:hypothetical protein
VAETDKPSSPSSKTFHEDIDFGDFDDYSTAPIWRGNPSSLFDVWTFNSSGFQTLPNFTSTWKDRGYRLLPYFAKVSQKKKPTDFISCLLPTMDNITAQKSPEFAASPPSVINNDPKTPENPQDNPTSSSSLGPIPLGAKGMLDEAGRIPKTQESCDVFV